MNNTCIRCIFKFGISAVLLIFIGIRVNVIDKLLCYVHLFILNYTVLQAMIVIVGYSGGIANMLVQTRLHLDLAFL